ncbi:unnamed protein product [Leptidea sinapis]|uniref:LIM zinc-binding domain-containing protein n=1 Tax=Leptidea sinapis TaxID=189913 RepID=A0A5E4QL42_9NEOP|nr:unnamed protein product [Leptidea sinapis]
MACFTCRTCSAITSARSEPGVLPATSTWKARWSPRSGTPTIRSASPAPGAKGDLHRHRGDLCRLHRAAAQGHGPRRRPAPRALPAYTRHAQCAGCGQELSEGQALVALERQWHTGCFACGECGAVLDGEYMGRDGVPKCGDPFGDGEEMFLQGAAIWHPRCGPAPHPADTPTALDRASSELQFSLRSRTPSVNGSYCSPYSSLNRKYGGGSSAGGYRTVSPGLALRDYRSCRCDTSPHRITAFSYLTSEPARLRGPVTVADRPPVSPHFHRPPSAGSTRASSRAGSKASSRPGMRVLVDSMRAETPRPAIVNNDEPIELSHYPSAYKPPPGTKPKIERDDFPAPPYPYTDPADAKMNGHAHQPDDKLRREENELAKIQNASRTPSASHEATIRLRYSSPVGASPSRTLDRPRHDCLDCTTSMSDTLPHHLPSYNAMFGWCLRCDRRRGPATDWLRDRIRSLPVQR